jgi:nucleoside-diphosphate-sugar epimerase
MTPERAPVTPVGGRRVLVTGGSGFIGSHLCEKLAARGFEVASLSRSPGWLAVAVADGRCAHLPCDVTDAASCAAAIEAYRPHVLVHLMSHPDAGESAAQSQACIDHNVTGTLNVLEGFRRAQGGLFVYGDSTKVFGNCEVPYREASAGRPNSSYAITKAAGWQFCELYAQVHEINVCAIRPTMVYGPRQRFNLFTFLIQCVQRGDAEIRLDGGDQTRDPLYVDDAAEAYADVVAAGEAMAGRRLSIGGGEEHRVASLAARVARMLGSEQRIVTVPGKARPTEIWRSWCDNREAREALGWEPRTDLDAGLRATFDSLAPETLGAPTKV